MDADDLKWLLQTTETPEMADRLVLAQYKHGRISAHVIAEIGLEPWISQAAIQGPPAETHQSSEYATETLVDPRQEHVWKPNPQPILKERNRRADWSRRSGRGVEGAIGAATPRGRREDRLGWAAKFG
jgi:hypothetical protein